MGPSAGGPAFSQSSAVAHLVLSEVLLDTLLEHSIELAVTQVCLILHQQMLLLWLWRKLTNIKLV